MLRQLRLLLLMALCLVVIQVQAQETRTVTDDEVNAIAAGLYCPVCENIPLDACGTAACADWRYEIKLQLEQGLTEQEIVDDFVRRFGDRVVGTPQDPLLRFISLAIPLMGVLLALGMAIYTFNRWRYQPAARPMPVAPSDSYEALVERDLEG